MICVIDASSALSAVALLDPEGRIEHEEIALSGPIFDLPSRYRALKEGVTLTRVAVATGPGSFTGLRVGVSFGLGLAVGLGIPIVPLGSLELQAARSDSPVLAVSEAGRRRGYFPRAARTQDNGEPAPPPLDWRTARGVRPATA